jgi:hypothetical protein
LKAKRNERFAGGGFCFVSDMLHSPFFIVIELDKFPATFGKTDS